MNSMCASLHYYILFPLYYSSLSPSNVHQRMLHFMRPDGMSTDSPAGVQQSLLKKYQGNSFSTCTELTSGRVICTGFVVGEDILPS